MKVQDYILEASQAVLIMVVICCFGVVVIGSCSKNDNPVVAEHPPHPAHEIHEPHPVHEEHPEHGPVEITVNVNGIDIIYVIGDTIFVQTNCDDDDD